MTKTEKQSPTDRAETIAAVVETMAKEQVLSSWRDLEAALHEAWKRKYGASVIHAISAHKIPESLREKLKSIANGADFTEAVNENLIGGIILRIDDKRIDGSTKGAIKKIHHALS